MNQKLKNVFNDVVLCLVVNPVKTGQNIVTPACLFVYFKLGVGLKM